MVTRDGYRLRSTHPTCCRTCLTGKSVICPVHPRLQKYFGSRFTQITFITLASRPKRGAFRDRHGRWARDAVDAGGAEDESADLRTAKSCGPDASTPASSWLESFRPMTVTNKPDHRGEHEGSR